MGPGAGAAIGAIGKVDGASSIPFAINMPGTVYSWPLSREVDLPKGLRGLARCATLAWFRARRLSRAVIHDRDPRAGGQGTGRRLFNGFHQALDISRPASTTPTLSHFAKRRRMRLSAIRCLRKRRVRRPRQGIIAGFRYAMFEAGERTRKTDAASFLQ